MKAPIGQSELEFVFEIGNGPKPANDRHGFFLAGEFDQGVQLVHGVEDRRSV